ncbi:MAG: LamG domain-containing protein [Archangiaceae bacterium]|nr:LamG domain-containing protein [Archangiaceae bacterium]
MRTTLLPVGATGRYVRVTVNGNLENDWASITEVRVRGEATTGGGTGGGTAGGIGGGIGGGAGSAGTAAPVFNGSTAYVEIGDDDAYSQVTHGGLTIEAWVRPDSLSMSHREGSGYVHWMGKGEAGAHEWTTRMYQAGNAESRDNRISFYHFNPSGGLGAGSYFQDPVKVGEWIHVVGTIDQTTLRIYKNGALRDSDLLSGYSIRPQNTSSPLRIGTRDFNSFFQGSVARVAIYSAPLPPARIAAHYAARTGNYDAAVLSESTLVGYWRLNETSGTTAFDATGRHHGSYKGGAVVGGAQFRP